MERLPVTESKRGSPANIPWWESELPAATRELRAYLRGKLAGLREHHEDIINETLAGLAEELKRHASAFPKSWFTPIAEVSEEDHNRFYGLARTILMRRIADLFRSRAAEWARRVDDYDFEAEPDPTNIERKVLLQRMLQICVEVLANSPKEDRALLGLVSGADQRSQDALSPSERQRLRRLRVRLAQEILRRLGASVSELLKEAESTER